MAFPDKAFRFVTADGGSVEVEDAQIDAVQVQIVKPDLQRPADHGPAKTLPAPTPVDHHPAQASGMLIDFVQLDVAYGFAVCDARSVDAPDGRRAFTRCPVGFELLCVQREVEERPGPLHQGLGAVDPAEQPVEVQAVEGAEEEIGHACLVWKRDARLAAVLAGRVYIVR